MRALILLITFVGALAAAPNWRDLTAEQREAKRKELRQRLDNQVEKLRAKQKKGPLTPEEERRLRHLETIGQRFVK